jgi:hypothetical protein
MALRPLLLALLATAAGCELDPDGRCDARADCPAGLDCLNHVCANCSGDLECWSHTYCSAGGLCEPRAGRCWFDEDCPSWDRCDATWTCVLRPDHCASDAVCTAAYDYCDPAHHCSIHPGRCASDADCFSWAPTCDAASHYCQVGGAAGDDVLAWGTLVDGACDRGAVSPATTAAASSGAEVGFDCGSVRDRRAFVEPVGGALVYRHAEPTGADTLRRFHPEAVEWDAAAALWRYPGEPSADDEIVLTPGVCPVTWDRWIMRAGTGALLYGCPTTGTLRDFYDAAGVRKVQAVGELLAWTPGGYLLAVSGAGDLQVIGPTGTATAVTGLPAGGRLAHRATATGIRVAVRDDATLADELWEIDEVSAVAALVGAYAGVATSYGGQEWEVLDADGNLYGRAYSGTPEVILKRPLLPGATGAPVYDESFMPAGANDPSAATFVPFVRLQRGAEEPDGPVESLLVTRP